MATWQQVKGYILSNYKVSEDTGSMLILLFSTGNGRSQRIFVSHLDAGNVSSVRFASPFAQWGSVSSDRVLRATESALVSVSSIGDYLVASHTQLLATIDEAEIDWPLTYVAQGADDLEQALGLRDVF